jgi:hypothetical protein
MRRLYWTLLKSESTALMLGGGGKLRRAVKRMRRGPKGNPVGVMAVSLHLPLEKFPPKRIAIKPKGLSAEALKKVEVARRILTNL